MSKREKTNLREARVLLGAVLLSVILTLATIYVPFMAALFQTVPLGLSDWVLIIGTSSAALLIPSSKIFGRYRQEANG